jgi:Flp pilus assembly protein TadG
VKKFFKRQQGQSLVEFALIFPIIVIILFGIIEFGRLWETMSVLTSAAREGARVAAVTAPDPNRVQSAAQSVLSAANITNASIIVIGPNSSSEVIVTVQIIYAPITGSIVPGIHPFTLAKSTTMHWEG